MHYFVQMAPDLQRMIEWSNMYQQASLVRVHKYQPLKERERERERERDSAGVAFFFFSPHHCCSCWIPFVHGCLAVIMIIIIRHYQ